MAISGLIDISRRWQRGALAGPAVVLCLLTVAALPGVLAWTFSLMPEYDDEGTLLIFLRPFLAGHRMYDEVYSLYGPVHPLFYGLLYGPVGVPLTHSAGRLIASCFLLLWTAGFAWFCLLLSRSWTAMVVCFVTLAIWLSPAMASPGHPEELCLILLAAVLLAVTSVDRRPGLPALAIIGGCVAALGLIKINAGVYVGVPLLLVLVHNTGALARWPSISRLLAIGLLLLPVAVEFLLFDFGWVRLYCAFCILCLASTLLVFLATPGRDLLRPRHWWMLVAVGTVVTVLSIGGIMLAGSSGAAILNAVVLQNTHFVRNWYIALPLGGTAVLASAGSLLAALAYRISLTRDDWQGARAAGVVLLKLGFVLAGAILFALWKPAYLFAILVPFCWLILVDPEGAGARPSLARGTTALIGATMALYPFPVAGHQMHVATALPLTMVPVLACDIAVWARGILTSKQCTVLQRLGYALPLAAVVAGASATWTTVRVYLAGSALGLPGTTGIRIDPDRAADVQWIAEQLSTCRSSYSIPGLYSFAFWLDQPPPTDLNVNAALNFLSPQQQDTVVAGLRQEPDLCIVFVPDQLKFFDRGQAATDPPLLHYAMTAFSRAAENHGYIILRRRATQP